MYAIALISAFAILAKLPYVSLLLFLVTLASAWIPGLGWRSLGNALLAYAVAARLPVLAVMYAAMAGNGGQGWGTHYDAVMPQLAQAPVIKKWLYEALVPQATMWIGWTVVVGAIVGSIVAAVAHRGKRPAQVTV